VEPLRLPAVLGSLEDATRYVYELARAAALSRERTVQLRLAVEELIANVVLHGYEGRPGEYEVDGAVEPARLWIRVSDAARAFDPTQVPMPTDLDRPLTERSIGGLGLYLARLAVDDMTYEYLGGRNRSTLVVYRSGSR